MKASERLFIAFVMLELLVCSALLIREFRRSEPRIPDERLNDPLIIPDLAELARAADRGSAREWTQLGEALLGKGFYAHAEQTFREALRQDSRSLRPQFGLAFSLDRLGRMAESSQEYERVLKLPVKNPDDELTHAHALYALGRNALRLEQPDEAERLFARNGDFIPAAYQHSKLLIRSGRAAAALPTLEKVLEQVEFSLEFRTLQQRAFQALGRDRDAFLAGAMVERSAHLVSLNFNTDYISPFDQLTGIARKMKALAELSQGAPLTGFENELLELRELMGAAPQMAAQAVDEQLLYIAVGQQQPDKIFPEVAKLRGLGYENPWMLEAEGDAWQMQGEQDRAAASWQRALLLTPRRSLHDKLAAYFDGRDTARRDWHRGQSALAQGISAYRRNRLQDALEPLRAATELLPGDGAPWYYIGEMHFHLHELADAKKAYEQCLQRQSSHGRALAKLEFLRNSP